MPRGLIYRILTTLALLVFAALALSGCSKPDYQEEFGRDLAEIEETIATGTFTGANNHSAAGDIELVRTKATYYLRFANNFTMDDGPDLYVYLGKDGHYSPSTLISVLGQNDGARFYEIPSSISVENYTEVWIWSRIQEKAYACATLK